MAQTWWIVVPSLDERNVAATPKDALIAQVPDTSTQYGTWLNTDNGGASYQGKTYYRRMGPFTSLKDAQAAFKTGATNAASPIPGVDITPGGGLTAVNPLAGIEGLSKIFGDFFSGLTNGKMWRSLGWVLLGILLMLAGAALWLKGSISPLSMLKKP